MQEQDHFHQGEQQSERRARRIDGIHSFHEVVYPLPLWKRVAFILLHLVIGFVFGLLVMLFAFKIIPELSKIIYMVLLVASIPGVIHPKTRLWGFGLLIALILAMPFALFASF